MSSFQPHILALLEEFGFETFETYTTGKSTMVYEGKVTRFEAPLLPLPVADLAEIAATIAQFDLMAAEVPADAPWTAPQAAAWDAQTMATWLDDNIICRGARAALDVMVGGALCARTAGALALALSLPGRQHGRRGAAHLDQGRRPGEPRRGWHRGDHRQADGGARRPGAPQRARAAD